MWSVVHGCAEGRRTSNSVACAIMLRTDSMALPACPMLVPSSGLVRMWSKCAGSHAATSVVPGVMWSSTTMADLGSGWLLDTRALRILSRSAGLSSSACVTAVNK